MLRQVGSPLAILFIMRNNDDSKRTLALPLSLSSVSLNLSKAHRLHGDLPDKATKPFVINQHLRRKTRNTYYKCNLHQLMATKAKQTAPPTKLTRRMKAPIHAKQE